MKSFFLPNSASPIPAAVIVLLLAACQTTPPAPPATQTQSPAQIPAANAFGERKGWIVEIVDTMGDTPKHCEGRAAQPPTPAISFVAGPVDSGFRITGAKTELAAGSTEPLTVTFDNGVARNYVAKVRDDGALEASYPTQRYDELTFPFARAHEARIVGTKAGTIATLTLNGSSWVVNATDECRRMNARK